MNPEDHSMMRLLRSLGANEKALEVRASLLKSGTVKGVKLPAAIWQEFNGTVDGINRPRDAFFSRSQQNAVIEQAAQQVVSSALEKPSEAPASTERTTP